MKKNSAGRTAVRAAAIRAAAVVAMMGMCIPVAAQETSETYVPGIWVDPDGCEHWVMDDGWEGYMDIRLDREGRPVCNRGSICGVVNTDQMFASGSAAISARNRQRLADFFAGADATAFIVAGHTDARGSDEANLRLSEQRADAVARAGQAAGVKIVSVSGYGERQPKATNATAAGRAQNRRVELFCLK